VVTASAFEAVHCSLLTLTFLQRGAEVALLV
jgi:hypothetical protein